MGTVRREGDWRLEKRGEGIYEITFRKEPQERIITEDAPPHSGSHSVFDFTTVTRVSSFSEAEGIFQERIHGPPPLGMSYSTEDTGGPNGGSGSASELDLSDVPPYGWTIAFFIGAGFSASIYLETGNSRLLLVSGAFFIGGMAIVGYAGHLFRTAGLSEAWSFLAATRQPSNTSDSAASANESTVDGNQTPPPSESLKNELYFERADRRCEWCEEQIDQPEVHHITPRSEGGSNDRSNLIVLCPTCHRKADSGAISRSKLTYRISQ